MQGFAKVAATEVDPADYRGTREEQRGKWLCRMFLLMDTGFLPPPCSFPCFQPQTELGGKEKGKCEWRKIYFSSDSCVASEGES